MNIKTKAEIEIMKEGGKILGEILQDLKEKSYEGQTLDWLNTLAHGSIWTNNCIPAFLGYNGYPKTLCASVNDRVVHAIPNNYVLKNGDVLKLDLGLIYKGLYLDSALTTTIGNVSSNITNLIDKTEQALYAGIDKVAPGHYLSEISEAVGLVAYESGLNIIKELGGHGIGKKLHEDYFLPNCLPVQDDFILVPGMTMAIEPIFTLGKPQIDILLDRWTIVTKDGAVSAHFEHTVAVTDNGPIILTKV